MNESEASQKARELKLLKLYEELTGSSETQARDVFMHLCDREEESETQTDQTWNEERPPWPATRNHEFAPPESPRETV